MENNKTFKINNHEIRTTRGIKDFFRRNNPDKVTLNIENHEICCIFMGYYNIVEYNKMYETLLLYADDIKGSNIRKTIQELGDDIFCPKRYLQYIEYKKINPQDVNSDTCYKLKFGDNWEEIKKCNFNNRKSPYDPEYISKKYNICLDEAIKYVEKYKSDKSTSKENFIKKHGEDIGGEMFDKFQKTSKHTKEKYIEKYGELDGIDKWNEYVRIKKVTSKRSIDYWLKLTNNDFEYAEKLRYDHHIKNFNTASVNFWINKGLSDDDAIKKVKEIYNKKQLFFARASKESLKYLNPLKDIFENLNYRVYLGIDNYHEFTLYDKPNKKLKFYDFTVPEIKLIIEYHGEKYHPNPNKLTKEEWDNWQCYNFDRNNKNYSKINANDKYEIDQYKKNLAINNDYTYIELWSSDSYDINMDKINTYLKSIQSNIRN
jgi:hypothetical protein